MIGSSEIGSTFVVEQDAIGIGATSIGGTFVVAAEELLYASPLRRVTAWYPPNAQARVRAYYRTGTDYI